MVTPMLQNIAGFLRAVWSHWVVLMSGIASVLTALWLQITNKPAVSPRTFWLIAAACFVIAFSRAWSDRRRPWTLNVHASPPGEESALVLEVRPRLDTLVPWFALIPQQEADRLRGWTVAPSGALPGGTALIGPFEGEAQTSA